MQNWLRRGYVKARKGPRDWEIPVTEANRIATARAAIAATEASQRAVGTDALKIWKVGLELHRKLLQRATANVSAVVRESIERGGLVANDDELWHVIFDLKWDLDRFEAWAREGQRLEALLEAPQIGARQISEAQKTLAAEVKDLRIKDDAWAKHRRGAKR
ncbi:MAG: hypothetical protein M3O61_03380 [Gemmatimonadota bacterium]|nr:hypothetical protein [Gemmatimonadota bacterium]